MSNANDFIIENGVLTKYVGPGGDVYIPDGVESIGFRAFAESNTIVSVSLAQSMKSIGYGAFEECNDLTSVSLNNGLVEISDRAFYQCTSLMTISLPESLEKIGSSAFWECSALSAIAIPNGVTSLGDSVFYKCEALHSVSLGNGIRGVAHHMFAWCTSLQSILIPGQITAIGESAFMGCSALRTVEICGSVKIYKQAFAFCRNLKCLRLLENEPEVQEAAFEECYGLANEHGMTIVGNTLFAYNGSSGKVVIPEGVVAISDRAFRRGNTLQELVLPNSVSYIGYAVFSGCENLCSINIPEGIEEFSDYLFSNCSSLSAITIPEGVRKIGQEAFRDCERLQRVVLPDSLEKIGKQAFEGCSQLYHLRLPKEMLYDDLVPTKLDVVMAYIMGELDAGESLVVKAREKIKTRREKLMQKIAECDSEQAFVRFCDGWKKIKLDHLEEYIEIATKANATKVTAALLEYKQKHYSTKEQEAKEQDRAEKELGMKELSVADWRKIFKFTIQDGCVVLTAYKGADPVVSIPEKIGKNAVTEIGWEGFEYNKGLTEIVIPATIKTMGFSAFGSCPDLEIVRFAPGLESTGQMTFNYCKKLKDVYIPASVTRIASFFGCPNLTIHAPAGSYAEAYAKEHNIPFVAE